jgi:hypothetical protein
MTATPSPCMRCQRPYSEHTGSGRCPKPNASSGLAPVWLVVVLIVAIVGAFGWRLVRDEQVRNDPPATCQLLGGHWSLLGG